MSWQVEFVPDEVESMSIACNGVHVLDWSSAEGDTVKPIPAQFSSLPHVHFVAEGHPNGRNAHCRILWDGREMRNMEFDNGEDWDS